MGNFYSFFLPFLFAFLLLLLHNSRSHESPYIYVCDTFSVTKYFPVHYLTAFSKQLYGVGIYTPIVQTRKLRHRVWLGSVGCGRKLQTRLSPSSATNLLEHPRSVTPLPGPTLTPHPHDTT